MLWASAPSWDGPRWHRGRRQRRGCVAAGEGAAESGAALARLVTDPGLATTNGKYFEGLHEIRSSVDSYDHTRAADLWRDSAALTELADEGR